MFNPAVARQNSAEDCGAACLITILRHYKRQFASSLARDAVGTSRQGTTLLGLRRGAESVGFNARQVIADRSLLDRIGEAPLPAIIHWEGNHWVVLFGKKGRHFLIGDPAVGLRRLSSEDLLAGWSNGVMLLLEPDQMRWQESDTTHLQSSGFLRILRRLANYKGLLSLSLLLNVCAGILGLAAPFMMQVLADDVLIRGDESLLYTIALAVTIMTLFRLVVSHLQSLIISFISQKIHLSLVKDYGYRLFRMPLSYFDRHQSGEAVSRIMDIGLINGLLTRLVFELPMQFFMMLASLIIMLVYSPVLALAAIISFTTATTLGLSFIPAIRRRYQQLVIEGANNQGFLVETFRAAILLKAVNGMAPLWDEYQGNFGRLAHFGWSLTRMELASKTLIATINGLTAIGVLWYGGTLVIDGVLSIGKLLAFSVLAGNCIGFIQLLVSIVREYTNTQIVVERLNDVLDGEPECRKNSAGEVAELLGNEDIICEEVSFHHSGRVSVLDQFNLTISGGRSTCIIGPSGSGKTTLAKLITRMYEAKNGVIRYGAFSHRDLSPECVRRQVTLVPQESHFWSRSIVDNFRIAAPTASLQEIISVCQLVGADSFIQELPDSYSTVLGEHGVNLSGGQRQRLALARAMINDPPVLVLDESTNSLDEQAEQSVLNEVLKQRKGRTTILISHSTKVIGLADDVININGNPQVNLNGESVEEKVE